MKIWAAATSGFASILIGWVLPMIAPTLPRWVQIAVFFVGVALLVLSIALNVFSPRTKRDNTGITIKMGHRNKVGRIGNDYDGQG